MRHRKLLELLILIPLFVPAVGAAQGRLFPVLPRRPQPPVHHDPFTVESINAGVDITRQVAVTTIEQVFGNPSDRDREGMYLFPIPESASITRFTMWMNGEPVDGEIVEAAKARRIYEDIVRRMRDPGLLEYVGRDLFRARVYPIPGRGEVRIRIEYAELLRYDGGVVGYQFPMRIEGTRPGRVGRISLQAEVRSDVPVKSLYSPSHEIDARINGRRASCGFEAENTFPDRDFVLYYTVSTEDVGLNLLTHRAGKDGGYFLMLLSPGRVADRDRILAKDIVFVLDTSGSMKGEKIDQARRALTYCVRSLDERDRFNIVAFATGVGSYADRLVDASREEIDRAVEYIDGLRARGGTDINEALLTALDMRASGRPRMIVFLTDGVPTVGETNVDAILDNLGGRDNSVRIFSFGVGHDVNTALLDRMSLDRRGAVDYVEPGQDIEVEVTRFYDKVRSPVLSDVEVEVDGIRLLDVFPRRLPDLFNGTQLVVMGRYEGAGTKSIELRGRVGNRVRRFRYEGRFERSRGDFGFLPRLWASRKIAYLLSEINMGGPQPEIVDAVIELSLEHGIVTPYTSWLILEEGSEEDRISLRRLAPPPETTWGGDGGLPESLADGAEKRVQATGSAFRSTTGGDAFDVSATLARDRDNAVAPEEESGLVKIVDGLRFVLRNGEWVDQRYENGDETTEIEFLSDGYFALLREHPEAKRYLALGERVTFVVDNHAYRIVP